MKCQCYLRKYAVKRPQQPRQYSGRSCSSKWPIPGVRSQQYRCLIIYSTYRSQTSQIWSMEAQRHLHKWYLLPSQQTVQSYESLIHISVWDDLAVVQQLVCCIELCEAGNCQQLLFSRKCCARKVQASALISLICIAADL